MEYVECSNCKNKSDCERTYLGGCTDGERVESYDFLILRKKDKELYYSLVKHCKNVIECPNEKERQIACSYCRMEEVRKRTVKETVREIYELMIGEYESYIPTEIAKEIAGIFKVEV